MALFDDPLPKAKSAKNRITFRSHIDTLTGYGQTAIALTREWQRLGYEVCISPYKRWEAWGHTIPEDIRALFVEESPDDWELLLSPPAHEANTGKRCIQHTMWESNRLPQGWVERLNTRAAVIVPCEWNQLAFDAAGVTVPIHRCPLGIDTDIFCQNHSDFPERITFGAGGRMAHGGLRKGIWEVYEAFRRAFPTEKDVALSVKVFPDCDFPPVDDPRVTVIREAYTDPQMAGWYRSLTCYVSAAAAEGFGLMPLQAMACGRPCLMTQATGHAEYFTAYEGWPVRYDLKRAEDVAPGNPYYTGYWYMPDLDDMARQMRAVYENEREARIRGAFAAARASRFSWGEMAARLVGIMQNVGMLE